MFHHVARTVDRRPLFTTWTEGCAVWSRLATVSPRIAAACVMPNHVHLLTPTNCRRQLARRLADYVQWLNARRRTSGKLIDIVPEPEHLTTPDKIWRNEVYIHLNPCRPPSLVRHPLAWPLSTFRDAMGLSFAPLRRRHRDLRAYYDHHQRDAWVAEQPLPMAPLREPTQEEVLDAVSSLTRSPMQRLHLRTPARTLALRATKVLTSASTREIADAFRVTPGAVRAVRAELDDDTILVARAIGDDRFYGLTAEDLRRWPTWPRHLRGH